jgi:nucleoid DNA-binding protein
MQELLASYLVQKKVCNIPHLGCLRIKTKPAELDVANKQLFPPTDEILFNEIAGNNLADDLVEYVADHQHINTEQAEEKITNWCNNAKQKLDSGERVIFNAIGSLQKNATGNIFFQGVRTNNFYEAVSAERVIHENETHTVLVGDNETTSSVMNEFYREEIVETKSSWKIWAIVLLAISLIILIFHFYNHGFATSETGNQSSLPVFAPSATYSKI